jgi:hypothetical protein
LALSSKRNSDWFEKICEEALNPFMVSGGRDKKCLAWKILRGKQRHSWCLLNHKPLGLAAVKKS